MKTEPLATTRVGRWLAHRRAPLALALLAGLLTTPALRAGLIGDDYFQRLVLLHLGELGAQLSPVWDLFAFMPARLAPWMLERGILPWWSDPALHIAFARPLSALTHVLDYALWPDSPALQHLHSLLWFALAVALVAWLYRRVHMSSLAVAGLAGLLFAVEDAHVLPATWLANRNATLCLVAGVLVLGQHVEWQRTRRARHLLLALGLLALGLGCGEATLGSLAYVFAWQATCEEETRARRWLPLVPYAAVVLLWRALYDHLGYGAQGSFLYLDPGRQPLLFLAAVGERASLLLANQWLQAPINVWLVLPRTGQLVSSALAALLLVPLAALLLPLLRRERLARFWMLGMLASLLPVCAAFPMDRLLLFPGIGAFALMATLIAETRGWPWAVGASGGWRRRSALGLLVLHGPLAALFLVVGTALMPSFGVVFDAAETRAPRDEAVSRQTFVFVNGNDFPVFYLSVLREVRRDAPLPRRSTLLASMDSTIQVQRDDATTLVLTPVGGFLAAAFDGLLANPARPFDAGQRIVRAGFVAEIRSVTPDGRPAVVAFHFDRPLDDPSYRWLYWRDGRLMAFPLPAVGEGLTVAPSLPVVF